MTALTVNRILPRPDIDSAPHFQAAAQGRLSIPRCEDCGAHHWYPARQCPKCHGWNIGWPTLSGEATLYSYTVIGHSAGPFVERVPYVVGMVQLAAAPEVILIAELVDIDPANVHIGMRLQPSFETVAEGIGMVSFRPDMG